MTHWFEDNSLSIGRTPLVRLNRVTDGAPATVLAKIEGRNPAYSVKCRIGAAMIWDAEKRGLLGPGKELVEPTSGNTGIALAFVAAARGIPLTLTMPETMSIERRKLLLAYGAKLVLTEGAEGHERRDRQGRGDRRLRPRPLRAAAAVQEPGQPGDPRADHRPRDLGRHRRQGRHLRVGRRHRRHHHRRLALHQEDARQADRTRSRSSRPRARCSPRRAPASRSSPAPHKIQGIGAGFVPDVLDLSLVDAIETGDQRGGHRCTRAASRARRASSPGISCGAAVAVAVRLAKRPENAGKTIVVVLPDSGERYLSSVLFEGVFDATGLPAAPAG